MIVVGCRLEVRREKKWKSFAQLFLFIQTFILSIFWGIVVGQSNLKKTQPIEVTIHSGTIRGELLWLGPEEYTVFKGIPYAAPPVGALQFQKPIEPANWRGVMNATQFSMSCAQKYHEFQSEELGIFFKVRRSEDCLYLNVFSPPPYTNDTYPVMVFIHGGGFQIGSASDYKQEPILQNFVSRRTVFVTLNYRLGPLGFASTGDKILPGNNGLWDIILALKWVQKNIEIFGGDKHRVTLMGHGSGAAAASILALSPRAESLFHRMILLSGTAITPGMVRETAKNATWALQEALKCRAFNSTELLNKCLYRRSRNELLQKPKVFYDDYQDWVPVIDHYGGVIPEAPEILADYRPKIPMIVGTTRDESALHLIYFDKKEVNLSAITKGDAEWLVRNLTSSYSGFTNHKLITEGCYYEYVHTRVDPKMNSSVLKNGVLDMYSHFWFHAPASRLADYYAADGAPVYLYSFDHVSENLFTEDSEWKGSFHGSDLIFLFDIKMEFLDTRRDQNWQIDRRVTEIYTELLTNFARTGDPTPPDGFLPFNWTNYNRNELNYLSITDSPKMNVGYHWRGHVFWNVYALRLDAVDVGNLGLIADLRLELGDYQLGIIHKLRDTCSQVSGQVRGRRPRICQWIAIIHVWFRLGYVRDSAHSPNRHE